jgi:hypothetical protein
MSTTEWITDRLPTLEDALEDFVLVWDESKAILWTYYVVEKGQPWAPIHKLIAPYVKPKRWVLQWSDAFNKWIIKDIDNGHWHSLAFLSEDDIDAAQRILDIYNEVMP